MPGKSWSLEEDRQIVAALAGRVRVSISELEGMIPGRSPKAVRDHWYNIRARADVVEDIARRPQEGTCKPKSPQSGIRRGYSRDALLWAATEALRGNPEALVICAHLGVRVPAVVGDAK
jgi:hypothetical protein